MTTSRKQSSVAFWIIVALVAVLVGYPLSFGPACWLADRVPAVQPQVWQLYWPMGWIATRGPRPMRRAIWEYVTAGFPKGAIVALPIGPDGVTALSICQDY